MSIPLRTLLLCILNSWIVDDTVIVRVRVGGLSVKKHNRNVTGYVYKNFEPFLAIEVQALLACICSAKINQNAQFIESRRVSFSLFPDVLSVS